jgi:2-hydroxy-6-oxonona-2,4-dienedioate hydrolase
MRKIVTESGFVAIGNANIYYEVAGEGQSMVLVHAGVADSRQWNSEFEHFAQDFRVLRYDMRGYGKSLPIEGEFSHMGDLTGLLDQLGFDQPIVLIGCSMGGSMAMDFALAHPSRVKVLVMVGSGPSGLRLDVPTHPKEAEAEEAYKSGDLERLADLEAQIWFDGMGRTPDQVNQDMRRLALEMNRLALSHVAKGLGKRQPDTDTPAAERLDELEMPLLVVVGEHDEPYSHAAADHMVEKVPSARKVVLEDAAHLANMDHPGQFQRTVSAFLDEVLG